MKQTNYSKWFKYNPSIEQIKLYTSDYFNKMDKVLKNDSYDPVVRLQFICTNSLYKNIVVCGIDQCLSILYQHFNNNDIKIVYSSSDGQVINKNEPILVLEGKWSNFGILENIFDGILTFQTNISTNCFNTLKLLYPQQDIIFMGDRSIEWWNNPIVGYACYIGGIRLFTNESSLLLIDEELKANGTMPHALIACYNGKLNKTIDAFYNKFKTFPTVLVDYNNNVLEELKTIRNKLNNINSIRIDTSSNLIDKNLVKFFKFNNGINPNLINKTKRWLNKNNFNHIKIIVSSGINSKKIKSINFWSKNKVDYFGLGSYLLKQNINISADIVQVNSKPESKFGRIDLLNKNLK